MTCDGSNHRSAGGAANSLIWALSKMAAAVPHISNLPEPALRAILLGFSDNLLLHVAACARVCVEWRRVVVGSVAYGMSLPLVAVQDWEYGHDDERTRVLKAIAEVLDEEGEKLGWDERERIGDAGAAVLGAALQAMPRIRFTELDLEGSKLAAAGVSSLAPALRRPWGDGGLKRLDVLDNPLGDDGVAALAKALPPTLETLGIGETDCGDDGLVALAAALPALTRLTTLDCSHNPDATARGWEALAGALPSAPALERLLLYGNRGMGSDGAVALAAAIPNCPQLRRVDVSFCALDEQVNSRLRALGRPSGHPAGALDMEVDDYDL
eukprot:COSAG04_NODE_2954_length_3351_cov_2.844403_2_plen_326_part_00